MIRKLIVTLITACLLILAVNITSAEASSSQLIIINKSTNQLAYYNNGKLIKVFRVATGKKPSYTPEGTFKIVNKIKNRPYYKGKVKGGDPRNPLGDRWLGINARGTYGTTYAIHGNNNPSSIGRYVSNGCIRMYDEEVRWLFDQVRVNAVVIITTSQKSFDSIAAANGFKVSGGSHTPVVSTPSSSSALKKGHRGSEVKQLQQKLHALGYNTGGIDGVFGVATERAVRDFQRKSELAVDGIVGSATKKALHLSNLSSKKTAPPTVISSKGISSTLRQGSRGNEVMTLQQRLHALGYRTGGIDGIFGAATNAAVRNFQRTNNLDADGVVGPITKKALNL
ncbi:L,D-transpeptidase family protein [Metabacillus iocasae]|uniref:Peptidoglycan hydrolase-like protein with peptidoglycan-binding domain n=1 Tax=Priestia iocasae TaxID=2291674 RepID=A0ABS2QRQ8_9BACI|nr:peptidoglycan-binding protein [Metabacillus iocasae]MBM7702080.1 peptidoglycan hydrolase-like protein with peptidoglycan-binding domain [Metabacillus iocasae]